MRYMRASVRFGLGLAAVLLLMVSAAIPASAAVTFNLNHSITGGRPAADPSVNPWLTANISGQNGNQVLLDLRASNLSGNEDVH